jgi:hypothetical protein
MAAIIFVLRVAVCAAVVRICIYMQQFLTGDYPKPARRSITTKIKIYKNHKKWIRFFGSQ